MTSYGGLNTGHPGDTYDALPNDFNISNVSPVNTQKFTSGYSTTNRDNSKNNYSSIPSNRFGTGNDGNGFRPLATGANSFKLSTPNKRQHKTPKRAIRMSEIMNSGVSESEVQENFQNFSSVFDKLPPFSHRGAFDSDIGALNTQNGAQNKDAPNTPESHKAMGNNSNSSGNITPFAFNNNFRAPPPRSQNNLNDFGRDIDGNKRSQIPQPVFGSGFNGPTDKVLSSGNENFDTRHKTTSNRRDHSRTRSSNPPFTSYSHNNYQPYPERVAPSNSDFLPEISGLFSAFSTSEGEMTGSPNKNPLKGFKKLTGVPLGPDGNAIETALKSFHHTLEKTRDDNNRLKNLVDDLKSRNFNLNNEYDDLLRKYSRLEKDRNNEIQHFSSTDERIRDLDIENDRLREELNFCKRQIDDARMSRDKSDRIIEQRLLEISALKQEIERLRSSGRYPHEHLGSFEPQQSQQPRNVQPPPQWNSHPNVAGSFQQQQGQQTQPQSQQPIPQWQQPIPGNIPNVDTQPQGSSSFNGQVTPISELDQLRVDLAKANERINQLVGMQNNGQASMTGASAGSEPQPQPTTTQNRPVVSQPSSNSSSRPQTSSTVSDHTVNSLVEQMFQRFEPLLNKMADSINGTISQHPEIESLEQSNQGTDPSQTDQPDTQGAPELLVLGLKEKLGDFLQEYLKEHINNTNFSDSQTVPSSSRPATSSRQPAASHQHQRAPTVLSTSEPISRNISEAPTAVSETEYINVPNSGLDNSDDIIYIPVPKSAVKSQQSSSQPVLKVLQTQPQSIPHSSSQPQLPTQPLPRQSNQANRSQPGRARAHSQSESTNEKSKFWVYGKAPSTQEVPKPYLEPNNNIFESRPSSSSTQVSNAAPATKHESGNGYNWEDEPTPRPSTSPKTAHIYLADNMKTDRDDDIEKIESLLRNLKRIDPGFQKRKSHGMFQEIYQLLGDIEKESDRAYALQDVSHGLNGPTGSSSNRLHSNVSASQHKSQPQAYSCIPNTNHSGYTNKKSTTSAYPQHVMADYPRDAYQETDGEITDADMQSLDYGPYIQSQL